MWFDPFTKWILRSPFHGVISQGAMLIICRGRKSAKLYTVPVNYIQIDHQLITISFRERTWWRNLRGNPEIHLLLRGKKIPARAQVFEDHASVEKYLAASFNNKPEYARYLKVRLDPDNQPVAEDLHAAAKPRIIVLISI